MVGELQGSFALSKTAITEAVAEGVGGTYLLSEGKRSENNRLIVSFVGMADDLREGLMRHVGSAAGYTHFWYRSCDNIADAYLQACNDYHLYSRVAILKSGHPKKTSGAWPDCPTCEKRTI